MFRHISLEQISLRWIWKSHMEGGNLKGQFSLGQSLVG